MNNDEELESLFKMTGFYKIVAQEMVYLMSLEFNKIDFDSLVEDELVFNSPNSRERIIEGLVEIKESFHQANIECQGLIISIG
ncbi:hypothetical protein V6R21_13930 [Limibacter armeniacum]|uniref:hypothetical protein n=1 Tax=Limibacter armeniacum TaxID=466084 RepID=UPI002FE64075